MAGVYALKPINDVAKAHVQPGGIHLWDSAPFLLGRSAAAHEGFAFPAGLSQLSSRHCTLKPARGEVRDLASCTAGAYTTTPQHARHNAAAVLLDKINGRPMVEFLC